MWLRTTVMDSWRTIMKGLGAYMRASGMWSGFCKGRSGCDENSECQYKFGLHNNDSLLLSTYLTQHAPRQIQDLQNRTSFSRRKIGLRSLLPIFILARNELGTYRGSLRSRLSTALSLRTLLATAPPPAPMAPPIKAPLPPPASAPTTAPPAAEPPTTFAPV
jgi:hypothetical protein